MSLKVLLKIPDEFTIFDETILDCCRDFLVIFSEAVFYYHIEPYEVDRFWIIEIPNENGTDGNTRMRFVESVKKFANLMNFEIQNKFKSRIFFAKNDLKKYC